MEITLGTAAFGLDYGVANNFEQVPPQTALEIIDFALANGIKSFDTATSYGTAERVLGQALHGTSTSRVVTKLTRADCINAEGVVARVRGSLENLSQEKLNAVLLHDASILQDSQRNEVKIGLLRVLELGLASAIGLSAYSETEVLQAKSDFPELTVFQLPENICDRRLYSSRSLLNLSESGNSFYVRSIFLQGLLTMNPSGIPENLKGAKPEIESFHSYLKEHALSVIDACVGYAKSIPWATSIVFGTNSVQQLSQIIDSFSLNLPFDYLEVPRLDAKWLDPRTWS